MKDNLRFIGHFLFMALFITLIFFICYATILSYIGGGDLVYYRGIKVILSLFILFFIILFSFKDSFSLYFPSLCLAGALTYSFHITIPVIIDRSISIQIIGSLKNTPMTIENLNKAFLDGYVDGYSTTCRRLNEQIAIGNIAIKNDMIYLTKKGIIMQKIFNKIAEFFKVEDRYIKGDIKSDYLHHYDLKNNRCFGK